MQVSVIIPTYKPQSYLWKCLDSLYEQTMDQDNFELILVLNGCCNPYKSLIDKYFEKHPFKHFLFIQTDRGGVSNARNMGLDRAKGEYVAFIDDDDYVSPSYLEELYEKVSPDTISLCYPYAFNDGFPDNQLPYSINEAYDYCYGRSAVLSLSSKLRKYFSGPCMKLIPMGFIQDRRFDVRFQNGEDSLFMFSISDKIQNLALTSKNAVYYRRFRENSAVTRKRSKWKRVKNEIYMIIEYTRIYLSDIKGYDFKFYLSRISAEFGCILGVI